MQNHLARFGVSAKHWPWLAGPLLLAVVGLAALAPGCSGEAPVPRRIVRADQQPGGNAGPEVGETGLPLFGPSAAELLTIPTWTTEQTAVDALARIGIAAVEPLSAMLRDPDPRLRSDAARALARIGSDARQAVPELTAALDDRDEEVRRHATRALGAIGPAAGEAVPALVRELRTSAKEAEAEVAAEKAAANKVPTTSPAPVKSGQSPQLVVPGAQGPPAK